MAIKLFRRLADWPSRNWIRLLLGLGILLRIYPYLLNRALWLDEAMLANNLIARSFAELAQPLADNQSAPLGQIWLTKLLTLIAGHSEYILRLPSLLAGIAALFLFLQLARKFFYGHWILWALAFFVFCDPHIYYSSEFKQYAFDLLFTLGITLATLPLFQINWQAKQMMRLGLLGMLALWFSQPAIFVLAGAGLSLLAFHYKHWQRLLPIIGWGALWLLNFGLYYWLLLADNIGNDHLQSYHRSYFLPLKFWQLDSLQWYVTSYFSLFRNPAGILFQYLAGAFALFGLLRMSRWWMSHWLLLFGPMLLALLASGLQLYSTLPRLMLFATPALLFAVIMGWREIEGWVEQRWTSPWPKRLLTLAAALMLLQPVLNGVQRFTTEQGVEEIKEPLRRIAEQRQEGDLLYLYPASRPAFTYYAERFGFSKVSRIIGRSPWEDWQKDFKHFKAYKRVWLIFSHDTRAGGQDQSRYWAALYKEGQILEDFRVEGSGYLLYAPKK